MTSVKIKMLDIPSLRYTPENFVLKGYLLREVLWMKYRSTRRRPVILYKTLFRYLGVDTSKHNDKERHRCMDIRARVKKCLDYWKKSSEIKGYGEGKDPSDKKVVAKIFVDLRTPGELMS